jgi:GNAT superfamily N-acetyltransferase
MSQLNTNALSVVLRPYHALDRAWVATAHAAHYTVHEKFSPDFSHDVEQALDLLDSRMSHHSSCFLILETSQSRIGSIFLYEETQGEGRIRLFHLVEQFRKKGLGRLALRHVMSHAHVFGYHTIRVSTFERHRDACRLYQSYGFQHVTGSSRMAYGQFLRQVDFELKLNSESSCSRT